MLEDNYLRHHDYLRISITDKCNLKCRYCMPPKGVTHLRHDQVLRNEEFVRLAAVFASLGVKKIRYTGGEPLVRKGFTEIADQVRRLVPGLQTGLTTNGILLGDHLDDLQKLNIRKLNISLDSLDRSRYEIITGYDGLGLVLATIERLLEKKFFEVKINAVLFSHTLTELDDFLEYFKDKDVTLRFIERMPFTEEDEFQRFLPAADLVSALEKKGDLRRNSAIDTGVARLYDLSYGEHLLKIGIIPPISHRFCDSCSRLRLTADGHMKTCLYTKSDVDLLTPLRNGLDDDALRDIIIRGVKMKQKGHNIVQNDANGGCHSMVSGIMSRIGG